MKEIMNTVGYTKVDHWIGGVTPESVEGATLNVNDGNIGEAAPTGAVESQSASASTTGAVFTTVKSSVANQQPVLITATGQPVANQAIQPSAKQAANFGATNELVSKSNAIRMLRVSQNNFESLSIKPAKVMRNPYKGSRWMYLYNRADIEALMGTIAIQSLQRRKYNRKDYDALFKKRYKNWRDALPDACRGMIELNSRCKDRSCKESTKRCAYDLKTELAQLLSEEGVPRNVYIFSKQYPKEECWSCEGTGIDLRSGCACRRCDGTGVWREAEKEWIVEFQFCVSGSWYSLRMPCVTVLFPYRKEMQRPISTQALVKPQGLKPVMLTEVKNLVRWVVVEWRNELTAKTVAAKTQKVS